MTKLLAFHSKPELKDMMLEEILKHQEADQIIQGAYENDNQYCAVGCSIHSLNVRLNKGYDFDDHSAYKTELGIPLSIAYLQDRIFEGLPKKEAMLFPYQFISSINSGADLSMVIPKFLYWLLGNEECGVFKYANGRTNKIITTILGLLDKQINGQNVKIEEFRNAAYAAYAAASEAAVAAAVADHAADAVYATYAEAAVYAVVADHAADAVYATYAVAAVAAVVADHAADAVYAYAAYADDTAYAVAAAVYAYADAADAADDARYKHFLIMRNKLLQLLKND